MNLKIEKEKLKNLSKEIGQDQLGDTVELTESETMSVLEEAGNTITLFKKENQQLQERLQSFSKLFSKESFEQEFDFDKGISELDKLLSEPREILKNYKEKALGAYRQFAGEKTQDTICNIIENANLEQVKAFMVEYGAKLEERHEASCVDCGSKNLTRASSQKQELHETEDNHNKKVAPMIFRK